MPTPDTRKGTIGSSGQTAGMPTTQSAPSTGPTSAPSPPITTMATTRHRLLGANVTLGVLLGSSVTSRQPASAAMPPDTANASNFMRVVEMSCPRPTPGCRARDHRAGDAGAPQLGDDRDAPREERRHR